MKRQFAVNSAVPCALAMALISLALLWPALLNGGPFYMADTPSYVRGAASGLYKLLNVRTAWTEEFLKVYGHSSSAVGGQVQTRDASQIPATLSGRSIYYGTFLYVSYLLGSFWIAVVAQSLVAASAIYLTIGLISRSTDRPIGTGWALAIGLVAAAATPLGYFAGYLMPDIFGGLGLLAAANILFLWNFQKRWERVYWTALLVYSLLAHNVNLMFLGALVSISLAFAWWRKMPVGRAQVACLAGCILLAVIGQLAFVFMVDQLTGKPPIRPPFVAMRQIANGPGYAYLKEHCGEEHYLYCRVLHQSNPQHDELLWSKDREISLFRGLTPEEQRVSAAEQRKFLVALVADRPVEVLSGALADTWQQLLSIDTDVNFNYFGPSKARFHETVPASLMQPMTETLAYRKMMPVSFMEAATAVLAILSAIVLMVVAVGRAKSTSEVRAYCWCLLLGVLINAAICGALSGPKGRYEARLIWVLPVAALSIGAAAAQRRRRATAA